MRQGEHLSPVMFAIFLNDLKPFLSQYVDGLNSVSAQASAVGLDQRDVDVLFKMFVLLYADDTVLCSESAESLQVALDKLCDYCYKWSLTVNANKTKAIVFSRGKIRKKPRFYFNGKEIEVVFDFKYLGLMFNYNNKFSVAQKELFDRASRAMFALVRRCRKLSLPLDIQVDLFDKIVLPVLSYGCEVWFPGYCDLAQRLQVRFYKLILKLNKSTPTCMVLGEVGKYPVDVHMKTRMLCYWYRLVDYSNRNKLSSVIYRSTLRMHDQDVAHSSYIECVQKILSDLGLHGIWLNQSRISFSLEWFKEKVKRCLQDQYIQKWFAEVNDPEKHVFTNYRMFKRSLSQENYFTSLPLNQIISLTRFRTLNNSLPVQIERFTATPRCERLCPKCSMNDVGDEFHVLFVCPFFHQQRKDLIPSFYWKRPSALKFQTLFSSNNKYTLNRLAKFINILNKEYKG